MNEKFIKSTKVPQRTSNIAKLSAQIQMKILTLDYYGIFTSFERISSEYTEKQHLCTNFEKILPKHRILSTYSSFCFAM